MRGSPELLIPPVCSRTVRRNPSGSQSMPVRYSLEEKERSTEIEEQLEVREIVRETVVFKCKYISTFYSFLTLQKITLNLI